MFLNPMDAFPDQLFERIDFRTPPCHPPPVAESTKVMLGEQGRARRAQTDHATGHQVTAAFLCGSFHFLNSNQDGSDTIL